MRDERSDLEALVPRDVARADRIESAVKIKHVERRCYPTVAGNFQELQDFRKTRGDLIVFPSKTRVVATSLFIHESEKKRLSSLAFYVQKTLSLIHI